MLVFNFLHRLHLYQQLVDPDGELMENGDAGTEVSKMISPLVLTDALMTLSHLPNADAQEAEVIIMETLFDSHHPCIGKVPPV